MAKADPRNATYPMWDIKGELGKGAARGHTNLNYDQYCRWALEIIAGVVQADGVSSDELLAIAKDPNTGRNERVLAFVSLMANGAVFGLSGITNAMHGLVCRDPLFKELYEGAMTVEDYMREDDDGE